MTATFINETANNIYNIIKSQRMVMWSWGFHKPKACVCNNKATLSFRVQGYQYKGVVYVAYNEGTDLFDIYKGLHKKELVIEGVYFDSLVDILDSFIETGKMSKQEYENKVKEEYSL